MERGRACTDTHCLLRGPGLGDLPGSKCTSTMARTELPGPKSRRRTLRKSFLTSEFRKRSSSCGRAVGEGSGELPSPGRQALPLQRLSGCVLGGKLLVGRAAPLPRRPCTYCVFDAPSGLPKKL